MSIIIYLEDDDFIDDDDSEIAPVRLFDGFSGECVFLNVILLLCHNIKIMIKESEDLSEFDEFKRDLTIGVENLQDHLNLGDDTSDDLEYISEL